MLAERTGTTKQYFRYRSSILQCVHATASLVRTFVCSTFDLCPCGCNDRWPIPELGNLANIESAICDSGFGNGKAELVDTRIGNRLSSRVLGCQV